MDKVCTALKLRPHKIKLENSEEITIYSSIECKGIVGNDGRHYILDLLRTFPPDLNYNDYLTTSLFILFISLSLVILIKIIFFKMKIKMMRKLNENFVIDYVH